MGPFNSGNTASATHSWEENGLYKIKVKARDSWGAESDWSNERLKPVPGFEIILFVIAGVILLFVKKKNTC